MIRRSSMSTRASSRFVDVVGEERIDPHEEEATVVITVWFEVVNDESMWKLDKARLIL